MSNKSLAQRSSQKDKRSLHRNTGKNVELRRFSESSLVGGKTGLTARTTGELVKISLRDLAAVFPTKEVSMVFLDRGTGEDQSKGSRWLLLQEELPSQSNESAVGVSEPRSHDDLITDDEMYDLQKVIEIFGSTVR